MESQEKESPAKASSKAFRFRPLHVVVLVPVLAIVGLWLWRSCSLAVQWAQNATKTPSFSDASDKLKQTCVVPTLDSPLAAGQNVVWCSSFQLAWNEAKEKVVGAPLEIPEAAELANRLNGAEASAAEVDSGSVYATAGRLRDGIVARIRKEMPAKFPSHTLPDFENSMHDPNGILSYAYLTARVPFKHPFRQVDEGITFTDSQGTQTQVAGFGLWRAYLRQYKNLREQVEVLYARRAEDRPSYEIAECAIDLCRHSEPYQVVIAKVEPRNSLGDTLDYVRQQIADSQEQPAYTLNSRFGANDEMRAPEMFWRIDYRLKELIGRMVVNAKPPMPVVEALQTIEFRLDRCGAVLESESTLAVESSPRHFDFNRPFLVYMQKRGAERPFFVMWVDNAELLARR
jgi:hypothetical protein